MMNQDKKRFSSPGILYAMLLAYVGAVCAINLSGVPSFYDADMYTDIRYAMEAWEHKSIFPEGWVFGNQLYAVSTPVLAAFLYGLTGEPHLSMGLASTAMTLLVLVTFHWMLVPVVKSRQARMAGSVLFMGMMLLFGDAWHNTGGWQLLFTMCSYYACYAVNAFLAYGCYLRSSRLTTVWPLVALTCLLSFCTGIQSLRQTAVMTVPLLGVEFLRILFSVTGRKTVDKSPLVVAGAISAANMAGLVTSQFLQLEQVKITGSMNLTPLSQYLPELRGGILQALSLVLNHDPVGYLMLSGIVLICGAGAVCVMWKYFREKNRKAVALVTLLIFSVLSILAIDVMLTMLVRPIYYFMLFPLLACLASFCYDGAGRWGKPVVLGFLIVLFCLSCMLELVPAASRILHREEESAWEVSDYLLENGYTTLYGAWNQGADVVIASDWEISAGFWEYQEDPFFYYKYLCNPEIFRQDSRRCAYLFYGSENAQAAVKKAKTKQIEMTLLTWFPDSDIYLYTAPVNIMEAFG